MVRAKEPRKICPGELGSLYCIAVGHPIPTVLHRIIEAVEFVVLVPDQTAARSALNRRFSQLRRAHPQIFPVMLDWLNDVHTQKLFSSNGEHWARIKLIESVERIIKGEKPHAAFGMDQNRGAPPLFGFTKAEDAAIYAQYLHLCEGRKITDAKLEASVLFKVEIRDIDRAKISALDYYLLFVLYQPNGSHEKNPYFVPVSSAIRCLRRRS